MSEQKPEAPKTIATQADELAKRRDPVQRFADGADYGTGIKRADPSRVYVLVYLNENAMGVEFYEELGYQREFYREGGPVFYAAKTGKMGELMTYRGHALMSISREDHAKLRAQGQPGAGKGANHWSQIEQKLVARGREQIDHLRGIKGRQWMGVVNRTEATEGIGRI